MSKSQIKDFGLTDSFWIFFYTVLPESGVNVHLRYGWYTYLHFSNTIVQNNAKVLADVTKLSLLLIRFLTSFLILITYPSSMIP